MIAALDACVDLAAIAHNVEVIRRRAGVPVLAVVKADGYGHGAVEVARTALDAGAVAVGVATVAEALAVRAGGIRAPLIAWLHTPSTDFAPAVAAGVEIVVSSRAQLASLLEVAHGSGHPVRAGVKIDTGLGRNGVGIDEWPQVRDALVRAVAEREIVLGTAMCHLAHGDVPDHPLNDEQSARLDACVAELTAAGAAPEVVHISNSAAALARPDLSHDMVRAGIAIYGFSPLGGDHGDLGLVPAMTLTAEVSAVKKISAGQGVSYGHTWVSPRDTTLGLLPAGYADGVPRLLSNRLRVSVNGGIVPGVGRVCMDQMVVDLGPDTDVRPGDRAVLFGAGADGGPTATDWADTIGTIDYEIVSGIRGRAVRRHVDSRAAGR